MWRALLFLPFIAQLATAQVIDVDIELVLAVDTSRSMDIDELALQREGYAQALESPRFAQAVSGGMLGKIALMYMDWGGSGRHRVILPWTILTGPEDARTAAAILRAQPVANLSGTGISGAVFQALNHIESNPIRGTRRVIDISGDGPNNEGRPVTDAREAARALGIEVNGLPIMLKRAGGIYNLDTLDIYYQDCVITGPSAFVMPVDDPAQLTPAILRKLVLEIAGQMPEARAQLRNAAPSNCLIGEQRRMQRGRIFNEP